MKTPSGGQAQRSLLLWRRRLRLVMVVFQLPGAPIEQFDQDIQAVTDDLARLKRAAEKFSRETGR